MRALQLLYDLLARSVTATILRPWLRLMCTVGRDEPRDCAERAGSVSVSLRNGGKRILVHGASAGELFLVEPVLQRLAHRQENVSFFLTYANREGKKAAALLKERNPRIVLRQYLPWDVHTAIDSWIATLRPDLLVLVEMELWPNLIRACRTRSVPVCMVNARIFDNVRWLYTNPLFASTFSSLSGVFARNETEAARYRSLGTPGEAVRCVGDLKWVSAVPAAGNPQVTGHIVGASLHAPEDRMLLNLFPVLRRDHPGLRFVLAPRRLAAAPGILATARRMGLRSSMSSSLHRHTEPWEILVVDEIGVLRSFYEHAAGVVVGGSFVPRGGHNPAEVAAAGTAIVIGPFVGNVVEIVDELGKENAIAKVRHRSELLHAIDALLTDPAGAKGMGTRARVCWQRHQDIAEAYVTALEQALR